MLISLPYKCLLVSGKDAESYLNQRLTGRIDSVDTLLPNFALTPAGKIEGFYRVAKLENTFLITCEVDSGVDDALNALLRFKVSEKITVQICDELKLYHGFEKEMIRTDLIFKSLRTET
ncbi:MAG: hypothetical protein NZO16_05255, partial [Deltaproteobacteria bacterium]|nr:hypothetical protein [Deltaproteobacteria bacterium]